jgi:hypothetical protein
MTNVLLVFEPEAKAGTGRREKYKTRKLVICNLHWILLLFFPLLAQQPNARLGCLIIQVSRSRAITHHGRWGFPGRGIGPLPRHLPDNTQHSKQSHPRPPLNSNPQIPASEWLQTLALDRSATETSPYRQDNIHILWKQKFVTSTIEARLGSLSHHIILRLISYHSPICS